MNFICGAFNLWLAEQVRNRMLFLIIFKQNFLNEFIFFIFFIEFSRLDQTFVHNVKNVFVNKTLEAWK